MAEPSEVEIQIEELETRLERLRALYEQYFLGIEKIEPAVARKDVDRRIYQLRRAQIRNTARRFKLQTIIQRYNTFQQYWMRICREIENGTYRRHLAKAEKRFGGESLTIASRKRKRAADKHAEATGQDKARQTGDEIGALLDGGADGDEAMRQALAAFDNPQVSASKPAAAVTARAPAAARPAATPLDLDLDDDLLGAPAPAPRPRAASTPGPAAAGPPASPVRTPPGSAQPDRAAPSPPSALRPPVIRDGTKPPGVRTSVVPMPGGGPRPTAASARPASPAIARPQTPRPDAPSRSGAAGSSTPRAKPPVPGRAGGGWASLEAGGGTANTSGARPAAAPPAASAAISDDRVKQLHARLVAEKKRLNQEANVSMQGLAKTLRATETKLREKHGGKNVDFQIVVRDGKAVVKPVLR